MLTPGQEVKGYRVLISHLCIADPNIGTVLLQSHDRGLFLVADTSVELVTSVNWASADEFTSYTNALVRFHKIVDEEAFLYDDNQI